MVRRLVFAVACWTFVAALVVQVFLAGAGLFELIDFTPHGLLGWTLPLVPIVLLILAILARVDRRTLLVGLAVLVVAFVQPELAAARYEAPIVAAFHPLNAILLVYLAWTLARRATKLARPAHREVVAATTD